jgi:hypothetical protein
MKVKESTNIPPRTRIQLSVAPRGSKTIAVTRQTCTRVKRHTVPRSRSEVMDVRLQNVSLYPLIELGWGHDIKLYFS